MSYAATERSHLIDGADDVDDRDAMEEPAASTDYIHKSENEQRVSTCTLIQIGCTVPLDGCSVSMLLCKCVSVPTSMCTCRLHYR